MTAPSLAKLLRSGSTEWNALRKTEAISLDQTGATLADLFCANADFSKMQLVGTEWERCELKKIDFRDTDLSNAYFHGGRLHDCDFRGANLEGATFEKMKISRCDFTDAKGLSELELEDIELHDVIGLELPEDDDDDDDE